MWELQALISYFNSLPEGDELFRLVELLGLLSLVGHRLPDALAELLAELRAQAKAAGELRPRQSRRNEIRLSPSINQLRERGAWNPLPRSIGTH